jgi:secreted trypsin-like serine protease
MRRRAILLLATMAIALLLACAAALAADAQDYEAQVVGGTAVPDGKYPFVAFVQGRTDGFKFSCGGSLIDQDSVLTAAHCAKGVRASTMTVTVGRTVLSSDQGQKRHVSRIFVHPRYNDNTFARDAAVLKLRGSVSGIAPIELAATSQDHLERPGRYATIAGWGNTIKQPANCGIFCNTDSNFPDRMREARVPLVSDSSANETYDRYHRRPTGYIPPILVAAGKEGKDTCQGDSGGPLFAKTPNGPRQIGITSFGAGCGARGNPGVYTEVNAGPIRSFITDAARR